MRVYCVIVTTVRCKCKCVLLYVNNTNCINIPQPKFPHCPASPSWERHCSPITGNGAWVGQLT